MYTYVRTCIFIVVLSSSSFPLYYSNISLFACVDIPKLPVITSMNSLNTSISLTWTHDKTCFESAPVKYHVLVDTDTQPVITDQLTTEIGGVISGRVYTVSVMAVVDDSQRSDPDRESVTAGGYKED